MKHLRAVRGVKQEDVAIALGVERGTISLWETDRQKPTLDKLELLAQLYKVELWQLFKTEEGDQVAIAEKGSVVAQGEGNVVIGGQSQVKAGQIIGKVETKKFTQRVVHTPTEAHISEEQKVTLRRLVEEIVELEKTTKRRPKEFRAVWRALNGYMKVSTYHYIPREEFEKARKYLDQWKGRLQQPLKRKDVDEWRRQRYTAIHTILSKELGWDDEAYRRDLTRLFGVDSLTDLDDDELNSYYLRMQRLKSKARKK